MINLLSTGFEVSVSDLVLNHRAHLLGLSPVVLSHMKHDCPSVAACKNTSWNSDLLKFFIALKANKN